MDKHVISTIDSIFKSIEKEFDQNFLLYEELKDALEYFESRAKMFVADIKKELE